MSPAIGNPILYEFPPDSIGANFVSLRIGSTATSLICLIKATTLNYVNFLMRLCLNLVLFRM